MAIDLAVPHEARPTVQLYGVVDDQHVDPRGLEDGRRAQPVDVATPTAALLERVAGRDGLVDQQPGRLDLRVHVGQLGLHQLEVGDRPSYNFV